MNPSVPAARWRDTTSRHLEVLTCGRSPIPCDENVSATRRMFASHRSTSTSSDGVGSSASGDGHRPSRSRWSPSSSWSISSWLIAGIPSTRLAAISRRPSMACWGVHIG